MLLLIVGDTHLPGSKSWQNLVCWDEIGVFFVVMSPETVGFMSEHGRLYMENREIMR